MRKIVLRFWIHMAVVVAALAVSDSLAAKPRVQILNVKITERGYEPVTLKLRRNVRTRITFLRQTDATCANEVVIPEFGIRRALPLNQPVAITFTPSKKGEFAFTCGMNMMRGKLIVQ
jgi:plastocyanin domain-containing protein